MIWHIETLFHAIVIFGGLALYKFWYITLPLASVWLYVAIQKIG
jgi:hypothetical protein